MLPVKDVREQVGSTYCPGGWEGDLWTNIRYQTMLYGLEY